MNGGNGQPTGSSYRLDNISITYDVLYTENRIDYVGDYFPYGKILREFVNADRERYLTTQHERDAETGLDYRGARYYDADVARFLSLDPHAKDYGSLSAYSYVAGMVTVAIDPDGKDFVIVDENYNVLATYTSEGVSYQNGGEIHRFVTDFESAREYLSSDGSDPFADLIDDSRRYLLIENNGSETGAEFIGAWDDPWAEKPSNNNEAGMIVWNSREAAIDAEGVHHSPAMILFHESVHATNFNNCHEEMQQRLYHRMVGVHNAEEDLSIDASNEKAKSLGTGDGGNGEDIKRTTHGITRFYNAVTSTSTEEVKP